MRLKHLYVVLFPAVLCGCTGSTVDNGENKMDSLVVEEDFLGVDTIPDDEERKEEMSGRIDGTFDDFLFAFTHNRSLFYKRIKYPLRLYANGEETVVSTKNFHTEFSFLEDEYYTVLYGDTNQIGHEYSDSIVKVERINLHGHNVRQFRFERGDGRWMLANIKDYGFEDSDLEEFLGFYSRFSSDSVYQAEHISQPLAVSITDPEDNINNIDGTIDAEQWTSFCSEVPSGVISNIRYGQGYGSYQVVVEKRGNANGLREVFVYQREGKDWKLTLYEN